MGGCGCDLFWLGVGESDVFGRVWESVGECTIYKAVTTEHHISLNSQFMIVLNGIICFSVQFCDNSLLMLKARFQVFSFSSKKAQGFSSDRKSLMLF